MEPSREPRDLTIRLPTRADDPPRVKHAAQWIALDDISDESISVERLTAAAGRARAHLRLAAMLAR